MKRLILTTLTALGSNDGIYSVLYTESAWRSLMVPVADLGGSVPGNLSLAVSGLPSGTTITLDGVGQQGDMAQLHGTVSRADESVGVNDTSVIEVQSGGRTLTTVSIPVMGVADDQ